MGRGKLTMELIEKEKARMITYQKRKKGLKKKAQEFSTLCGVPTCLIIYGPKLQNHPAELDFWPKERKDVMEVINLYREKDFSAHGNRPQSLIDFFSSRKRKVDDKITKLYKANLEAKFPRWDDRFNSFSVDQLKVLVAICDTKIEAARRRIEVLKVEQNLMEGSESGVLVGFSNSNQHSQVLFPLSSVKPLDMPLAPYYPYDQVPLDCKPLDNPMAIMMMNGGNVARYTQLQYPMHFDPIPTPTMPDNVMFNNPRAMRFCGPTMQPLPPFDQFPVLPSNSSQMFSSQVNEFYRDANRFGLKNEREMLQNFQM
ncbi:hypothetical protein Patl1_22059 [Pistacia atlantica]|uniref:Uncharacterized protein n=1 Tax=Pistacia atlantica TaxID=434234 RepID=A0ACC1BKW5_9ROSI|nr:hypothetical protein Patl1_22059 [Pistacia atlantica]